MPFSALTVYRRASLRRWRATLLVDDGRVTVRTRRGHSITEMLSGLHALAQTGRRFLLDGELVAGAGRASDFYALANYGEGGPSP